MTANSAMWIGETAADILGYAIAGLLVAALETALPLAFWLDAVTYLASAILLATMVVRPVDRGELERPPRTATRSGSSDRCGRASASSSESRPCWRTPSRPRSPSAPSVPCSR